MLEGQRELINKQVYLDLAKKTIKDQRIEISDLKDEIEEL